MGLNVGQSQMMRILQWLAEHECQTNFYGSSNAMEVKMALAIFQRLMDTHGLIYRRILCDRDAKLMIYDFPVERGDCINHISKRMFSALETEKV